MTVVDQELLLSERFEVAFNKIHEQLKKSIVSKNDNFTLLVREGRHHNVIKTYHDELIQYAKLRNALVHDKLEIGYYIAEPHKNIVERIEKIASVLTRPNFALSIATKQPIYFHYHDPVEEVILGIKEYSYSQYPVYNGKECVGLISTATLVKWMAKYFVQGIVDLSNVKVQDVLNEVAGHHPLAFVPKSSNIFDVEDVFELHHKNKKDLQVVIITENGSKFEKPLGIITAWDLIEIDYTAD